MTMMRNRGLGNSPTQVQRKLKETYEENCLRRSLQYLTAVAQVQALTAARALPPPCVLPFPGPKWFMGIVSLDIYARAEEILARITSTFGTILKIDSTKKVTVALMITYPVKRAVMEIDLLCCRLQRNFPATTRGQPLG